MKPFKRLSVGLAIISANWIGIGLSEVQFQAQTVLNAAIAAETTRDPMPLPPLIDRALFFADPAIANAQLSPDGQYLAFRKPLNGIPNVWVKGLDEPMDAARPVTADTESPIPFYFWSADGRYILYGQDKGGNENFHIYAVEPDALMDSMPTARSLTPLENTQARIYAVPKQTPNQIIVGLNNRDPQWHDVYRLDLTTGERTLIVQNDQKIASWLADLDGNIRLAWRQTLEGGTEILQVENGALTLVYTCSVEEICRPIRFHKNGQQVYLKTNRGESVDLTQLELFDLGAQNSQLVEVDPNNEADFGGAYFSEATDELIATYYLGDRLRIYPQEDSIAADLAFLRQQLPEVEMQLNSLTRDDRLMLVRIRSDVNPGAVYLFSNYLGCGRGD